MKLTFSAGKKFSTILDNMAVGNPQTLKATSTNPSKKGFCTLPTIKKSILLMTITTMLCFTSGKLAGQNFQPAGGALAPNLNEIPCINQMGSTPKLGTTTMKYNIGSGNLGFNRTNALARIDLDAPGLGFFGVDPTFNFSNPIDPYNCSGSWSTVSSINGPFSITRADIIFKSGNMNGGSTQYCSYAGVNLPYDNGLFF